MPNRDYGKDYDPMVETWHNRGVRGADYGTRHPVVAFFGGLSVAILATLAVVIAVAAVVLVGWQIGWWFTSQNVQRQDKIFQQSYGNQSSLRSDIDNQMATVLQDNVQLDRSSGQAAVDLKANRYQVVAIICRDASQVVGSLSTDQSRFVAANCEAGAVNPNSKYAH